MPVFRVEKSQGLDFFLRSKNVPEYKIHILLKHKLVLLKRAGQKDHRPSRPKTRLQIDDLIGFPDTLPSKALQSIKKLPFFDYVMKPIDRAAAEVFSKRPKTKSIKTGQYTLAAFFKALKGPAITHPIRDIILVSHADPYGRLYIAINFINPKIIIYEDLFDVTYANTFKIANDLFKPRPKDSANKDIPATLLIRGCRVGKARPFLVALKHALGGHLRVAAPKYFQVFWAERNGNKITKRIEYLSYSFELALLKRLPNRQTAIKAFIRKGFKFYDGTTAIPPGKWKLWLPQKKWIPKRQVKKYTIPLTVSIGNPLGRGKIKLRGNKEGVSFRFRKEFHFRKSQSLKLASQPKTEKQKLDAVKKDLINNKRWKGLYKKSSELKLKYPLYERMGMKDMNEFMKAWNWSFVWKNGKLYFHPFRYTYTLLRPIEDLKTKKLKVNYYPDPKHEKGKKVIIQLKETDSQFFTMV